MIQAGQYITDGTAVFLVCDIRDGAQVGDIKMSPVLRKGYVQANGALLSSAKTNYPRLVDFVQDNPSLLAADDTAWADNKALYVYDDTNDTLRVPDATGRVLQGGSSVQSVEAGLPNVTGYLPGYRIGELNKISYPIPPIQFNTGGASGALRFDRIGSANNAFTTQSNNGADMFNDIHFDASQSTPTYGNSTTVQPPALSLIPQIKY